MERKFKNLPYSLYPNIDVTLRRTKQDNTVVKDYIKKNQEAIMDTLINGVMYYDEITTDDCVIPISIEFDKTTKNFVAFDSDHTPYYVILIKVKKY